MDDHSNVTPYAKEEAICVLESILRNLLWSFLDPLLPQDRASADASNYIQPAHESVSFLVNSQWSQHAMEWYGLKDICAPKIFVIFSNYVSDICLVLHLNCIVFMLGNQKLEVLI